jgi:hypothetical protein
MCALVSSTMCSGPSCFGKRLAGRGGGGPTWADPSGGRLRRVAAGRQCGIEGPGRAGERVRDSYCHGSSSPLPGSHLDHGTRGASLLDHLIRPQQHRRRDREA